MDKIQKVKSLFLDFFPYKDFEFKIEFFDYLESKEHSPEELEILIKLIHFFSLKRENENKILISNITEQLKNQGVSLNFNIRLP